MKSEMRNWKTKDQGTKDAATAKRRRAEKKKAAQSGGLRLEELEMKMRASAARDGANRRERSLEIDNLGHSVAVVGG